MKGYPNGSFGVENPLTRAEAAVLLVRVLRETETMSGGSASGGGVTTTTVSGTLESVNASVSPAQITIDETSPQSASGVVLSVASGASVTLDGQSATLAQLAAGDAVQLTLTNGQVTAISATSPTTGVSETVTAYLVAQPTTVSLEVYGSNGLQTYAIAAGTTLPTLQVGDDLSLGLSSANQVVQASVTGAAPLVGVYEGSPSAGTINLLVNGSTESISVGTAPAVVVGGVLSNLGALQVGQTVAVDVSAVNGSALVIEPV
jgi:hypothetical protein